MTVYNVSTIPMLITTIKSSKSGDVIVLANNTYITDSKIPVACNGVSIIAQSLGQVIFQGGQVYFAVNGSNNTISGFQFVCGATTVPTRPGDLFQIRGSNNIIDNMNFNGYYVQRYVNIYPLSQHNTVRYCNFQGKPADPAISGSQIEIQADANVVGFHKISYCSFQQMIGNGGDFGNEPIRLGESTMATFNLSATVEYCVFDNTQLADGEIVSVKSMFNVIRYNTVRNNYNAMFSFRNGNNNVAYGNFIFNSGAFRVKQCSNVCIYNNYIENSHTPLLMDDVSSYPNPSTYENNIILQNNTFYNCNTNNGQITLGTSTTQTGNYFVNNIFYNSDIFAPNNLVSFYGNMYYLSNGVTFDSTNINAEPLITLNANNYYSVGQNSPALGTSITSLQNVVVPNVDTDTNILLDLTGALRPFIKSIGCNETYCVPASNVPLTVNTTGPSYVH
jgi:hypothetical protein